MKRYACVKPVISSFNVDQNEIDAPVGPSDGSGQIWALYILPSILSQPTFDEVFRWGNRGGVSI